nr:MAG TPA: hypothetical protein [Caudoviricetes sp.]
MWGASFWWGFASSAVVYHFLKTRKCPLTCGLPVFTRSEKKW